MAKYALMFHGGATPETREEGIALATAWSAWLESLGAAVADRGAPVGASVTVGSDGSVNEGGGANPVSGYSMLNADSLEAAIEMTEGCPIFDSGGSIEVAEILPM